MFVIVHNLMTTIRISKKWKIWFGVIFGFILLMALAIYIISIRLEPIVAKKIKENVSSSSKGLYSIEFKELDVNIAAGNLVIKGIQLNCDSIKYKELDKAKKAPQMQIMAGLNQLDIQGVGLWNLLRNKKLEIAAIVLDTLKGNILVNNRPYNNKKESADPYELIKERIKSLQIDRFRINAMDLDYQDNSNGKADPKKIKGAILSVKEFRIDESSSMDSSRFLYSKNLSIEIPGFKTTLDESPYQLSFDNLKFSSSKASAQLSGFALLPTINLQTFAKNDKQNKPLVKLQLDSIQVSGIDVFRLWKSKILIAQNGFVERGDIDLAKDKRYQQENVSKIGESPAQQLMKIKQPFNLRQFELKNINLSYSQISDKYEKEGRIDFTGISGIISNMTNDSTALRRNKTMLADLHGHIYGKGRIKTLFTFNMLSPAGEFSYKGGLSQMEMTPFNRILQPLLNLKIAQGNIEQINFDMKGTDLKNWGDFTFQYDHLKIDVLKTPEKGKGKKKILSFIANNFYLNDSNPDANGKYHTSHVDYDRNPNHPFFKAVWKSLLQGIIESTGTDPKYLPGI